MNGAAFADLGLSETETKSGIINMQRAANNKRFFMFFSSLENCTELQHIIGTREFYQQLGLGIITKRVLWDFAENLTALADEAYFRRDLSTLERISQSLISLPLPEQYRSTGLYYRALGIKWQGGFDEARKLLEEVERIASLPYRAKALQSLGAITAENGDYKTAFSLFHESGELASRKEGRNLLTAIVSHRMIGVLKSIEGDHQTALRILENLSPLVRTVGLKYPVIWHDFQNSLAVELTEVGRLQEAQQACNIALASPFAPAYPEWQETALTLADRLREPSRSFASVSKPQKLNAPAAPRQEHIKQPNNGPTKVISINSGKTPIRVSGFESKPALSAPASILHFPVRSAEDAEANDSAYLEKRYQIMIAAAESTNLRLIDALYETLMKMRHWGDK